MDDSPTKGAGAPPAGPSPDGPAPAPRSPVDQLRDYLERPPAHTITPERQQRWRPGTASGFYRIGMVLLACLLSVGLGLGLVFAIERPVFGQAPPNTALLSTGVPSPAPTIQAAPTAEPAPTSETKPTAAPLPTEPPLSAAALLQRMGTATAALRSGQFAATIEYGPSSRSSALVRFDLGEGQGDARFHIVSTYQSVSGTQELERLTIGQRSWQRVAGSWAERAAEESILDQIHVFLPHASERADMLLAETSDGAELRWYDAGRDVDVTLLLDPATGVPRQERELTRATGAVRTVTYGEWNEPVAILPPN